MARSTPFKQEHTIDWGVEVTGRCPTTKQAVAARCKFCVRYGRDSISVDGLDRKRKRTDKVHTYTAPFTRSKYISHLKQHNEMFETYVALSIEDKGKFFDAPDHGATSMLSHIVVQKHRIYTICAVIVKEVIGGLLLTDEVAEIEMDGSVSTCDEGADSPEDNHNGNAVDMAGNFESSSVASVLQRRSKARVAALKLFIPDNASNTTCYNVKIPNPLRFDLAIAHVGAGMSFRQTAKAIQHAHDIAVVPRLSGITNSLVGGYVRVNVAVGLQRIANLMQCETTWGFSLCGDGSTHRGHSFFDVRIRLSVRGNLHNLHLVAVPMLERHTAENIFLLLARLLSAVCSPWKQKLLAVCTDGEPTMTGVRSGLVARMEKEAVFPILRVWCVPHQIDLVLKRTTGEVAEGVWVDFVYKWCVHLRKQQLLIQSMHGLKTPKKTNRWAHLSRTLQFYLKHRRILIEHTVLHATATPPTALWWVLTAAIAPIVHVVASTVVDLQAHNMLLCRQEQYVQGAIDVIRTMLQLAPCGISSSDASVPSNQVMDESLPESAMGTRNIHQTISTNLDVAPADSNDETSLADSVRLPPNVVINPDVTQIENGTDETRPNAISVCYVSATLCVTTHNVQRYINNQGSFVAEYLSELNAHDHQSALKCVAKFAVDLAEGLAAVRGERTSFNTPLHRDNPPVLPRDVAAMEPSEFFTTILPQYHRRMGPFWTRALLDKMEDEQRALHYKYNTDFTVKANLDKQGYTTPFNVAWDAVDDDYPHLRQFCGTIATAFPNSASVESDFSILKWEMDEFRSGLSDLSLKGIFQAKQYQKIPSTPAFCN
jgi:hypothetical protein